MDSLILTDKEILQVYFGDKEEISDTQLSYWQRTMNQKLKDFREIAKAQLNKALIEEHFKPDDIVSFKPCDCHEVQGKILSISAPSQGGERMLLVTWAGKNFEILEHEANLVV